MTGIDIETSHQWSLASWFGSEHPFFIINAATITSTWALLVLITIIACVLRILLRYEGQPRFIVLYLLNSFITLTKQSLGEFNFNHCVFACALFIFIALSNMLSIIPGLEEPTNDINTTLALGIISFLYTQGTAIAHSGLIAYIRSYFKPVFILLPLNIVGKLASIISLAFRLFGNIAGGAIIVGMYLSQIVYRSVYTELIFIGALGVCASIILNIYKRRSLSSTLHGALFALVLSSNMFMTLFFGVFEGLLQAFVFTMLSLTYLATAIQGEGH